MKSFFVVSLLIFAAVSARAGDNRVPDERPAVDFSAARDTLMHADTLRVKDPKELKAEMKLIGTTEVPGLHAWQRKKSARIAVFSNMFLPGLGQLYNGRRIKVVVMVGAMTYYVGTAWVENRRKLAHMVARDQFVRNTLDWKVENLLVDFHREQARDFIWFSGGIWLIGMLDAFVDANLYDVRSFDPGIIESPSNRHYVGVSYTF
jgi:hypothetical protein